MTSPGGRSDPSGQRQRMEAVLDSYLTALVANSTAGLPLAARVKYSENQLTMPLGEGVWKDTTEISNYKITALDTERDQIGFMGALKAGGQWTMIALRLRLANDLITEVEAVLPGRIANTGAFQFGEAAANLGTPRAEFSTPVTGTEARDRHVMIWLADLHYEGIERGNGDIVPFGSDCQKIENGLLLVPNPEFKFPAASPTGATLPNFADYACQDQFNSHIWDTDSVTDRRYPVVDSELGIVVAFVMYNQYAKNRCADVPDVGIVCPPVDVKPQTLVLVEAFKLRNGRILGIEAVFTVLPILKPRGVW